MKVFSRSNLKKTIYYLKRNGLKGTLCAVRERLDTKRQPPYRWTPPARKELEEQRKTAEKLGFEVTFSIVVPTYRTPETYLREMAASVLAQSYESWELILADATEDDSVRGAVERIVGENPGEERICYHRLSRNGGIAANTNQGIALAKGDYVGLLDHDDLLAPDALYEMASAVEQAKRDGVTPELLYSDEDKCSGGGEQFYEPHFKEDFNFDLLLTNNYICHFMLLKRELIQELKLREEYEGAQDYDLALRAAGRLSGREECVRHIPKVLYHWRCHTSSTAENPRSKLYAYEAGRRALQDFADRRRWHARAEHTAHLGFYELRYETSPLAVRGELGAVGGSVIQRGRIAGGRMSAEGRVFYEGLPRTYSGYMNRAVLAQEAEALDIRNLEAAEELRGCVEKITGVPYKTLGDTGVFDASTLPPGTDYIDLSLRVSAELRRRGRKLLYLPGRRLCVRGDAPKRQPGSGV